jgi:hypothetical protein
VWLEGLGPLENVIISRYLEEYQKYVNRKLLWGGRGQETQITVPRVTTERLASVLN